MTREEAIKTLRELWRETNDPWYEEVYNMAIEALSAERTGEWERFSFPDGDVMECTNCGYRDWGDVWEEESRNYCPNCGAKMG